MAATVTTQVSASVQRLVQMEREVLTLKRQMEAKSQEVTDVYNRLGGSSYTDRYFYVDGDVSGDLRTDLPYSKGDFVTSISNMDNFRDVVTTAQEDAVTKVTGALDVLKVG